MPVALAMYDGEHSSHSNAGNAVKSGVGAGADIKRSHINACPRAGLLVAQGNKFSRNPAGLSAAERNLHPACLLREHWQNSTPTDGSNPLVRNSGAAAHIKDSDVNGGSAESDSAYRTACPRHESKEQKHYQ